MKVKFFLDFLSFSHLINTFLIFSQDFPMFGDFEIVLVGLLAMDWNMMTWDLLDCWLVVGFVL